MVSSYQRAVRSMHERGARALETHALKGRVVFTVLFGLGLVTLTRATRGRS